MVVWSYVIPVLLVLVIYVLKFVNLKTNKSKLPLGGRGWPIVGDSLRWYNAVASSNPTTFVQQQVLRYGKIFSCNIFGRMAVVSVDPAFNRFVMHNEGKLFKSSYPKSFRDLVGTNGVITAQGDQHRKLHTIASNMMRSDTLKTRFLMDIQQVLNQTFADLHHNQTILLQDVCRKLAINLMVNQLLGVSSDNEVGEMAQLFSDFVDGCLSVPINLPGFAYHTAMNARNNIIRKINKIICYTRHGDGDPGYDGGLVRRLVVEGSLPDEAIADFIINLLFAGNETTAKTMLFAIYFLTHSPVAANQLLEEHQNIRKKRHDISGEVDMLTWEDYKSMSFTQHVIDETLRLGGIAIWLMREAKEDVEYQDYIIPKGSFVVPFLSAVHQDENFYDEATTFNPCRWMDPKNQDKRNWRNSPYYSPFGGGPRLCPGAELARLQIALFLHYFIVSYRWSEVKEDRMSFFPSARLVNGFPIQLSKRA
ncbi:putative abieta-7,13-dien-18-ol hydroxylase [Helianthus annuus]|uniref:Abieta-7,13-dien-18-ol hydroxylase n=1 Tax=Helianthus annuus TaxID=4232 RepID=A0A251VCV4_HELAN|nr:abietadienol/abietadienal oxidase [Helianthus annuus]KAF5795675.1 putative abieta-7,13-dien-18-ol hydroxylase [Helianthus annuus]KAJ0901911.1 putative abieta-7,13-dien-18-ol hydroxylase [Helianthus annuus]